MSCITRCVLRWGLISSLALGGVTLLVGPERVAAGLSQVRAKAQGVFESCVDDPVALRRQLEELADEYPDRIAEVRGEIAEVDQQISQIDRDVEIASRVVAMTTEDLNDLRAPVSRAQNERAQLTSNGRPVFVRFEGVRYDIDEALHEAQRIGHVRETYRDRLASDRQQMNFLGEQKSRLTQIHDKLETEFATFQSQLWQLDRQIDAIERNERLIELTERQQETLASYDRFGKIGNLKQLEAKLAELRTIQEAQLQALAKQGIRHDYEDRAKLEINDAGADEESDWFEDTGNEETETENENESVAWLTPVVIE